MQTSCRVSRRFGAWTGLVWIGLMDSTWTGFTFGGEEEGMGASG